MTPVFDSDTVLKKLPETQKKDILVFLERIGEIVPYVSLSELGSKGWTCSV